MLRAFLVRLLLCERGDDVMFWAAVLMVGGTCYLAGFVSALPTAYRARWWKRQLAEARHAAGIKKLVDTGELSWKFIKEHAAYTYTYLPPGHGKHSLTLKRRLMLWWAQTEPRYEKVRVTVHGAS